MKQYSNITYIYRFNVLRHITKIKKSNTPEYYF